MKKLLVILTAAMFAACNSGPPDDDVQQKIDSITVKSKLVTKDTVIVVEVYEGIKQ